MLWSNIALILKKKKIEKSSKTSSRLFINFSFVIHDLPTETGTKLGWCRMVLILNKRCLHGNNNPLKMGLKRYFMNKPCPF